MKKHFWKDGICECGWRRSGTSNAQRYEKDGVITVCIPVCTRKSKKGLYSKAWYAKNKLAIKTRRLLGK